MSLKSIHSALSVGVILALGLIGSPATLPAAEEESSLAGLEGGRLSQEDLSKGDIIIVVWASWSPRSRDVGERVEAISGRWGERARVITVNFQETSAKAREFARGQKIKAPVYLDRDAVFAKRYAVTSLPFLVVLSDGRTAFAGKLTTDPDAAIGAALR